MLFNILRSRCFLRGQVAALPCNLAKSPCKIFWRKRISKPRVAGSSTFGWFGVRLFGLLCLGNRYWFASALYAARLELAAGGTGLRPRGCCGLVLLAELTSQPSRSPNRRALNNNRLSAARPGAPENHWPIAAARGSQLRTRPGRYRIRQIHTGRYSRNHNIGGRSRGHIHIGSRNRGHSHRSRVHRSGMVTRGQIPSQSLHANRPPP